MLCSFINPKPIFVEGGGTRAEKNVVCPGSDIGTFSYISILWLYVVRHISGELVLQMKPIMKIQPKQGLKFVYYSNANFIDRD